MFDLDRRNRPCDGIMGEGEIGGEGGNRERYFIFLHQQCNSLCFQVLTSSYEGREGWRGVRVK